VKRAIDATIKELTELINELKQPLKEQKVITASDGSRFKSSTLGLLTPTTDWELYREGYSINLTERFLDLAKLANIALKTDPRLTHFITRSMFEMLINIAILTGSTSVESSEFTDFTALQDAYIGQMLAPPNKYLLPLYTSGRHILKDRYDWINLFETPKKNYDNDFINKKQKQLHDRGNNWVAKAKKELLDSLSNDGRSAATKTALDVIPSLVLHGNLSAIAMVAGNYSQSKEVVVVWLTDNFLIYANKLKES
jgi:hypothetical protein